MKCRITTIHNQGSRGRRIAQSKMAESSEVINHKKNKAINKIPCPFDENCQTKITPSVYALQSHKSCRNRRFCRCRSEWRCRYNWKPPCLQRHSSTTATDDDDAAANDAVAADNTEWLPGVNPNPYGEVYSIPKIQCCLGGANRGIETRTQLQEFTMVTLDSQQTSSNLWLIPMTALLRYGDL
jgi:hypothetical protein